MTGRAAVLRTLPRHGFAPPAHDAAAAGLPAGDAAARSARLVAEFASGFWALLPDARAARWEVLAAEVVGPAAARLAELRPGLAVPVVVPPDPDVAEVAALVRQLVTLPAGARAVRRFAWLEERGGEFRRWAAAARVVLRTDMPLARLDPRLFDWFARRAAPRRLDRATCLAARDRRRAQRQGKHRLDRAFTWAICLTSVLGFVLMAYVIYRLEVTDPHRHERAKTPQPPGGPRFSVVEVLQFRAHDVFPGNRPPPDRYAEWDAAGRPAGRVWP